MNEREKMAVYSNEVPLWGFIVIMRTVTVVKIEHINIFISSSIFTFSVSVELMSMLCQLINIVSTIIIFDSHAYC